MISNLLLATGAWMFTGRTHPELSWNTIETNNFDIHYNLNNMSSGLNLLPSSWFQRTFFLYQLHNHYMRRFQLKPEYL